MLILAPDIHYVHNFHHMFIKYKLNNAKRLCKINLMLHKLPHGLYFLEHSMGKSILGLKFCFVSGIMVTIVSPLFLVLLTVYDCRMHPFLGSVIVRHCNGPLHVCHLIYTLVFFIQHWSIFVYGSFIVLQFGIIFLGTVLCITSYLPCLSR